MALGLVMVAGLLLRTMLLGNVFQSSDNCELPVKILRLPGYLWMAGEYYGVLINLLVKVFVGTVSALGITVTEFGWKLPIALVGTAQIPLTYGFLRALGCRRASALWGAALVAVLPVHIGQSRYMWGYEVLGVFFGTLAVWALIAFFRRPTAGRGLLASLAAGVYLISHGYIIPFAPCLAALVWLYAPGEGGRWRRFLNGVKLLVTRWVWVFPLLVSPLCYDSLRHALRKPTRLGFYLFDHLGGFVGNTGLVLALLLAGAALLALIDRFARTRATLLLSICGGLYFAPLVFGTPPGITVVRGYMLMGTWFWLVCLAVVLDRVASHRPKEARVLVAVVLVVTLWSDLETLFGRDMLFDPNLVTIERGEIPPDIGTKAAGYLARKHLAPDLRILALHRAIEPPNLYYYFRRDALSFFDLPLESRPSRRDPWDTRRALARFGPGADIVICEEAQVPDVRRSGGYDERVVIHSEGQPRMWIFCRPGVKLPRLPKADVVALNRAFDREFSWRPSLR